MINWTPISFCLAKVARVGIRRDIYWPGCDSKEREVL